MKRRLLATWVFALFALALLACLRQPQHIEVRLVWAAYEGGVVDATVLSDATAHRYGAGVPFGPTGPAGGGLTGTYPNPGLDAAAIVLPTCDAGYVLGSMGACTLLPESGGGGTITSLTQDTVGSGSGAVATTTLQAQAGAITFTDAGVISCAAGDPSCSLTQATESTTTNAPDLKIVTGDSSHATDHGGGNLKLVLHPPAGAGAESFAYIDRTDGTHYVGLGGLPGFASSNAAMFLGPGISMSDATHPILFSDGVNPSFNGYTTAGITLQGANVFVAHHTQADITLVAGYNMNISGAVGSYGGGAGVLGFGTATTNPSSVPAGGVVWMGNSGDGLHFTGPAGNGSGPFVDYMMSPTWSGTAANSQQSVVQLKDGGFVRTTNTASAATIYNITMTTGHSVDVQATCVARCVTSSGGCTPGDTMAENFEGAFRDISGTVTHLAEAVPTSPNPIFYAIDTNMLNVVITIDVATANTIKIQGTGLANSTIDWTCTDRTVWN